MMPWLWFYAPQLHLPWSGDVAQRIAPSTRWFFDGIRPEAGDGEVERQVFEQASYGKQLGWITEVLTDLAAQRPPQTPQGRASLQRLQALRETVERIKRDERERRLSDLVEAVAALRRQGGPEFEALAGRLRPLLDGARTIGPSPDTSDESA